MTRKTGTAVEPPFPFVMSRWSFSVGRQKAEGRPNTAPRGFFSLSLAERRVLVLITGMPRKPNYDFEKRRKEQERKRKKDEKREERARRREEGTAEDGQTAPDALPPIGVEGTDDQ
jgi:hypothetical protein